MNYTARGTLPRTRGTVKACQYAKASFEVTTQPGYFTKAKSLGTCRLELKPLLEKARYCRCEVESSELNRHF